MCRFESGHRSLRPAFSMIFNGSRINFTTHSFLIWRVDIWFTSLCDNDFLFRTMFVFTRLDEFFRTQFSTSCAPAAYPRAVWGIGEECWRTTYTRGVPHHLSCLCGLWMHCWFADAFANSFKHSFRQTVNVACVHALWGLWEDCSCTTHTRGVPHHLS